MKKNRLVLSDDAAADIVEQAEWYLTQSGKPLAARWEAAVTSAIMRIVDWPTTGTLCHFQSAELRQLRRIAIAGFPKHLLFYKFERDEVFVVRVVHGARDLEGLF